MSYSELRFVFRTAIGFQNGDCLSECRSCFRIEFAFQKDVRRSEYGWLLHATVDQGQCKLLMRRLFLQSMQRT